MKNKVLVEIRVPQIEKSYDVLIPVNKKVGNIIILVSKTISELSGGIFKEDNHNKLYDGNNGNLYNINDLIRNTNIRNGSILILM